MSDIFNIKFFTVQIGTKIVHLTTKTGLTGSTEFNIWQSGNNTYAGISHIPYSPFIQSFVRIRADKRPGLLDKNS